MNRNIFEEKSEEEHMRKYTYFFDEYSKERSFTDQIGYLLKYSIFVFAAVSLFETFMEYRNVVIKSTLYQDQELKSMEKTLA